MLLKDFFLHPSNSKPFYIHVALCKLLLLLLITIQTHSRVSSLRFGRRKAIIHRTMCALAERFYILEKNTFLIYKNGVTASSILQSLLEHLRLHKQYIAYNTSQ